MEDRTLINTIECMLFVAGDPVSISEIARVLDCSLAVAKGALGEMEQLYKSEGRGIQLLVTSDTAQLVSNRDYIDAVKKLLNPDETKGVSQSLLETLAVIAYRQPVTRADVEKVRGVRCDYAVTQLQKLNLIVEVGRKDTVGHPSLFGTTDQFLRQFGIHSLGEMPEYLRFSQEIPESPGGEIPVV
ncbi:MAG: SMC-Scp complex subunit ScpB [Clostridiaceae bacterium]